MKYKYSLVLVLSVVPTNFVRSLLSPRLAAVRRAWTPAERCVLSKKRPLVSALDPLSAVDLRVRQDLLRRSEHIEVHGSELPIHFTAESTCSWVQMLLNSYHEQYGEQLLDREGDKYKQARQVAFAPFAVVSHDFIRDAEDPIFIYGNRVCLETFGYSWDEFTCLPSRKSCRGEGQHDRSSYLKSVRAEDVATTKGEYSGVRVTKGGDPFLIKGCKLWNVKDSSGTIIGQAAKIVETLPLAPR